eukprot:scaffold7575_cov102-Isochrysis_galbana.AAC.3
MARIRSLQKSASCEPRAASSRENSIDHIRAGDGRARREQARHWARLSLYVYTNGKGGRVGVVCRAASASAVLLCFCVVCRCAVRVSGSKTPMSIMYWPLPLLALLARISQRSHRCQASCQLSLGRPATQLTYSFQTRSGANKAGHALR